jgi:hypothetical protein
VTGTAEYDMTFNPLAYVVPKGDHVELRNSFTDPKYVLPAPLLAAVAGETMRVVHGGGGASFVTLSVIGLVHSQRGPAGGQLGGRPALRNG